jgi:site-specific DNA-methyltransferase (adenine-specific)
MKKKRKKLTTQVASTDIEKQQEIWHGDCLHSMRESLTPECIDIVVTSPPYNLNIAYRYYKDKRPRDEYLKWLEDVFQQLWKVMKPDASFFLNMGFSGRDPWVAMDVAQIARQFFYLQNQIAWVKSIAIDKTYGHFKPINSKRFFNNNFEYVFHFTKTGKVPLDRLSIGVEYTHKSNIKRWKRENDLRCRGNVWFIPYKTIQSKSEKGDHPAIFPVELAKMCIKAHGVQKDPVVFDPFMGIGTTLVAARELNLCGLGIEIDLDYVLKARDRLK